jgi:hypothetical protein
LTLRFDPGRLPRSRQPATGPPDSYPDRTFPGWRRRAHVGSATHQHLQLWAHPAPDETQASADAGSPYCSARASVAGRQCRSLLRSMSFGILTPPCRTRRLVAAALRPPISRSRPGGLPAARRRPRTAALQGVRNAVHDCARASEFSRVRQRGGGRIRSCAATPAGGRESRTSQCSRGPVQPGAFAAKCLLIASFGRWARLVSNQRPLACEAR